MPDNEAFPREARLTQKRQFQRVFADAVVVKDRYFIALTVSNDQTSPRLGMAIAKKKAKRAVDRNRIKRLVRETYRSCQSWLPTRDIVVLSNANATHANNEELRRSLENIWRKISRLKPKQEPAQAATGS